MATIIYDTSKFIEKLKAAGIPEAQAKANALQDTLGTTEDYQT
jgi:hypothetical protein